MFASFVDRYRNESEVGVPRRFSIGTLFVLLTLYCVLFRVLILLGADATWTGLICLLFGAVTVAQMVLFRGTRPRAASIVAGALVCPAMLVAYSVDEVVTQWSGWTPLDSGLRDPMNFASASLLLAMVGAAFGYLVGCATAGVFYVMSKTLPSSILPTGAADPESPDEPTVRLLTIPARWLNPIQRSHPLHGALAAFLIPVVFGALLSQFVFRLAPSEVLGIATAVGACLAVWTGNIQMRVFWPIILCTVGAVSATGAAKSLRQILFIQDTFRQDPDILLYLVRVVGGATGLTFSAVVGWIQWASLRKRTKPRFGWIAMGFSILLLFSTAVLVTNRLEAWGHSPTQLLFKKVKGDGGYLNWSGLMQGIEGVGLAEKSGDTDFLQLRPLLDNTRNIDLRGPSFGDASVHALSGLTLNGLMLSGTSITDDAFEEVTEFSASYVYLNDTPIGDRGLAGLSAITEMQKGVEVLMLDRTKISDVGLSHLGQCTCLRMLSLNGCNITDRGMADLAKIPSLRGIFLDNCPVSDDGLRTVVVAVPRLERLSLASTGISDAGLVHLANAKLLREIMLEGTMVTKQGVERLRRALPSCGIKWSDPDEQRE